MDSARNSEIVISDLRPINHRPNLVAMFTVETRGFRIGGCLLACREDGGMTTLMPRFKFRDQLRFAMVIDDELRDAMTRAAAEELQW